MERITVLIEYADSQQVPRFGGGMFATIDGVQGKIVAVQFGDAFKENEELQEKLNGQI